MNEYYSSRRIENRNKYKLFFTFYESNRNESVLTIYLEFHRSNNSGFSKYFSRCRCCKINGCWRLVPGFQMDQQYSKERKSPGLLESTARPPLPPLRDHFLSIQRPRTAGQAGSREQRKVALKSSIATTSPIVIPRHRPHTSHASVRKGNSEASIFLTDFFNYDVKPKEAERRTSILSRKTDRAAKERAGRLLRSCRHHARRPRAPCVFNYSLRLCMCYLLRMYSYSSGWNNSHPYSSVQTSILPY